MREDILELFRDIASDAMDRDMTATLRYEIDQGENKTLISSSKRDEHELTLSLYPAYKKEEPDEDSEDPSDEEDDEEEDN